MGRVLVAVLGLLAGMVGNSASAAALQRADIAALATARLGETVRISTLGGAKSDAPLLLKRIDVYAPDAKILVIDSAGTREVPRSDRLFFISSETTGERVALSISPDGRSLEGTLLAGDGETYALSGRTKAGGFTLVKRNIAEFGQFSCDARGAMGTPGDWRALSDEITGLPAQAKAGSRSAVVAVETDNELLNNKFANNVTNATNYIAALFAAQNVIFERDLDLTLLQGTTILRLQSQSDPYSSTSATASSDQLDEFGEWWRVNQGAVPRAFVMLLSGKQAGGGASGIAWVGAGGSNYCLARGVTFPGCADGTCTAGHYNLNRVSTTAGDTASFDVVVTAHELAHNMGLSHTHCTDAATGVSDVAINTIDQCLNTEDGCYSGATSCPVPSTVNGVPNVRGTLMSYCTSGCTRATVLADRNRNSLLPRVATNVANGCFAPVVPNPALFANGFE